MVRGGQRQGAGRKSTWESKTRFEDTVVVRVPRNIKDKILEIAHKLDSGEIIDLDTNSRIKELEGRISSLELENEVLMEQLERYRCDLETESNKVKKLQQREIVTNSKKPLNDLVTESENHIQSVVSDNNVDKDPGSDLEPHHIQPSLFDEFPTNTVLEVLPISARKLSRLRFGLSKDALAQKKMKVSTIELTDWTRQKDPDGIAWKLAPDPKLGYVPVDELSSNLQNKLLAWMRDNGLL
jgi:hypothetical protein